MSDREALLAAILARPDDDTARLVYADWLDENGEPDRAEFIRVQIALSRNDSIKSPLRNREIFWLESNRVAIQSRYPGVTAGLLRQHQKPYLHENSALFWALYSRGFISDLRGPLAAFWGDRKCTRCFDSNGYIPLFGTCPVCNGTGRVSGPTDALVAIVREHPVERVGVTDREPVRNGFGDERGTFWGWFNAARFDRIEIHTEAEIPGSVYKNLPRGDVVPRLVPADGPDSRYYKSEDASRFALSDAILTPVREAAGVPQPHIENPK